MVSGFGLRLSSGLLAAIMALLHAQEPAGDVQKVTDPGGREVAYPTRLAEVIVGVAGARPIKPPFALANGEAVVTKTANTHVRMRPGDPDAVLFSNTFVRFDAVNRWLMRRGAAFVVNRRGKLALVAEGLETLFVGSQVYVEITDEGLLAYVVEGSVIMGATSTGIALAPSQAGRVARGGIPERTVLSPGEEARIQREIRVARSLMGTAAATPPERGGGGGGGKAVGTVLVLGAAGAGAYVLTRDKQPDLVAVPDSGGRFCQVGSRENTVLMVTNQGNGAAPSTTTQVEYPRGSQSVLTPPLGPGESTFILLAPPCGACQIRITVDVDNQAQESNEDNNVVTGTCF